MKRMKSSCKKCSYGIIALSLFITAICSTSQGFLHAKDKVQIIPNYIINYDENGKTADIGFDFNNIDLQKYEIIQLSTENGDDILYESENGVSNLKYQVTENGVYKFKFIYRDKKIEESDKEQLGEPVRDHIEEPTTELSEHTNHKEKTVPEEKGETQVSILNNQESETKIEVDENSVNQEIFEVNVSAMKETEKNNIENVNKQVTEKASTVSINMPTQQNSISPMFKAGRSSSSNVSLEGEFTKYFTSVVSNGVGQIYTYDGPSYDYTSIYGNMAWLSDSQKAWALPNANNKSYAISQLTSFTSKYQINFKRDWKLSAIYRQPFVADGFTISFHNVDQYKSNWNTANAGLGVYGSSGLPKGLVLELDGFAYANYGDKTKNEKAGSHMAMLQANGTTDPVLLTDEKPIAGGTISNPTSDFLGNDKTMDFSINYTAATRTLEWKIESGGKYQTVSKTFASDQEITDTMGTMTPYYTLSCAMNYTANIGANNGSPESGNSVMAVNGFTYEDIKPEIQETNYSVMKEDNSILSLGLSDNTSIYGLSGDTILVTHKIRNAKDSLSDIDDIVSLQKDLLDLTNSIEGTTYIPNSAKYYTQTDINNKLAVDDAIFTTGTGITYPKNSGACFIEYQIKVPEKLISENAYSLKTGITLGRRGMNQIIEEPKLKILGSPLLTFNQADSYKTVLDNRQYPLDHTKTSLTIDDVREAFYKNIYLKKSGDANFTDFHALLSTGAFNEFMTQASSSITILSNVKTTANIYNGKDGVGVAGTSINPNKMGVYYNVFNIYDNRFDQGRTLTGGNANGQRMAVRRIWICDNYVQKDNFHAMTENFEISELDLNKLSEEELKNKILEHLQLYSESLSVDANFILSGNSMPNEETMTSSNITSIKDFSNISIANSNPYTAQVTIELQGKTIEVPIKITVLESEAKSYVAIPKVIDLKDDSIDENYVGRQAKVELITEVADTGRNISVFAQTEFELIGRENPDNKYKVELYKVKNSPTEPVEKFMPSKTVGTKKYVDLGILTSSNKTLPMWLNAEKKANKKDYYKGNMTYVIEFL